MDSHVMISEDAFFEAYAFFKVFKGIHDKYFSGSISITQQIEMCAFSIPYVVNGAFACEVVLKQFIATDKVRGCQHDLNKMYGLIDDEYRDRIKARFMRGGLSEEELNEALSQSTSLFVDWRYFYEPEKEELIIPKNLYKMVEAICLAAFTYSEVVNEIDD